MVVSIWMLSVVTLLFISFIVSSIFTCNTYKGRVWTNNYAKIVYDCLLLGVLFSPAVVLVYIVIITFII